MLAARHDRREARRLRAEAAHAQLELDRHLALGAPHDARFEHARERLVGERCRGPDRGDLPFVLDLAQPLHRARARNELPAGREQLAQARVLLDGERRVVEAESALPLHASGPESARGGLEQLGGRDLTLEPVGHLLGRLGRVAEVGEEAVRRVGIPSCGGDHREAVRAGVAGQVAQVHGRAHEQPVHLPRAHLRRQQRGARELVHASASPSSSRSRASASR